MLKSESLKIRLWSLVVNFISKFLIVNSIFLLTLASSSYGAEDDDVYRILLLRGEWQERRWDLEFDRYFLEFMLAGAGNKVEVSYQNFGIDKVASPRTRNFYANNIAAIIDEQNIDLLVAMLPTAIDFILKIDSIAEVPKILVLPSGDFDQSNLPKDTIRIVTSLSDRAIQKTIETAALLNPNAKRIEFFSGARQTDLSYLARAEKASAEFLDKFDFNFTAGLPIPELINYVSDLDEESLVIMLPYAALNNGDFVNSSNFMPELSKASKVPLYGIVEWWLDSGIVGGYMTPVDTYAHAASQAALSLMNQSESEVRVAGDFLFDYDQIERWGLDLDVLTEPYVLKNKPTSILDDYSGFIYTIAVLVILLLAALFLQFLMLRRSEIAKRKLEESEAHARENEAIFQLLSRNSLDVIWTWDGDKDQTTYCSPSIEALIGYTPEEFMAQPMKNIMTDISVAVGLKEVFSRNSGAQVFEVELVRKDGGMVPCEIAAQPIDDSKKSNVWVGVTRDISKRKNTEKERVALESQVRQAQKFESLGTLAGGIAHDFNNILGVVMGLTELLKLKISDNDEAILITDKLMTTTDRAKMMVGQILAFSRQSSSSKGAMSLNALLLESFQIMQTGMPKSINLEFNDDGENVNVLADSNQLSQVFVNTLTNAYETVDEHEGEISVSVSVSALSETTKFLHGELAQGRYGLVKISDNGDGLTDDEIEKIFDPFYTSKELGNGMGLAISRGIIIGHGGAIDISSNLGEGTAVSIYMPIVEVDTESIELPKSASNETAKSTILLVDDQQDLLETVGFMLKELGHECISCVDPKIALDVIGNQGLEIDLVITDYSMPGISGLDIRKFSAKHRPNVPVILATGYSERIAQDEPLSKTPNYVLNKPFGFNELKEIINTALTED